LKINIIKLEEKIAENDYSEKEIINLLGVEGGRFSYIINDKNYFTIEQANKIVKTLNLSSEEAMSIFFPNFVA